MGTSHRYNDPGMAGTERRINMAREYFLTLPYWRFGLRQLFLWTAAIAFGLVALRSATMTWVAGMLGLVTAALATSILLIVFRHGSKRAYWIGFAIFGWLYLLVLVASWTLARIAANDSPLAAHNLPTQQLSSYSYHWLFDEAFEKYQASRSMPSTVMGSGQDFTFYFGSTSGSPAGAATGGMSMESGMAGSTMPNPGPMPIAFSYSTPVGPPPGPNESDFVNVAHALWTLLFAVMGGCLSFWLYTTDKGRSDSPSAVS
jgi:hypothetical protein